MGLAVVGLAVEVEEGSDGDGDGDVVGIGIGNGNEIGGGSNEDSLLVVSSVARVLLPIIDDIDISLLCISSC